MMNRQNRLHATALAAVIAMSLTACGGQSEGGSTESSSKETMTAMLIGSTADKELIEIARGVTEEFNADNEYNVEMKLETYENEQYKTKLASLMASNSQPDVFFTWSSGYLKPFAAGGKMLDLTPYLEEDTEWKSKFGDSAFGPVSHDGKIYAVPHGSVVAVMYYNTKIFEEQGLEVPKTYEEFEAVVKSLKNAGITPISVPSKDAWIAGQLLQQLANAGSGLGLFEETVNAQADWNDERYVEAGDRLKKLYELGAFPDGYLGMTNDEGRDLFTSGKTAMYYMGSWDMAILSDSELGEDISAFNIPAVAGGEAVAVGDVDLAYAVGANTKNPDAAVAFIKEFSTPEVQEAYATNASYLISTDTPLDEAKLTPLFIEVNGIQQELSGVTPWMDRVFGAGEGVEFNNVAQAVIAGQEPKTKFDELQKFAEANSER